jgi:hypothetical protein
MCLGELRGGVEAAFGSKDHQIRDKSLEMRRFRG